MHRDDVPIRRPCPLQAPELDGDHCTHCQQTVTDLSAGTEAEAEAWLTKRGGGCVSYCVDRRGNVRFGMRSLAVTGALAVSAAAAVALQTTVYGGIQPEIVEDALPKPVAPTVRAPARRLDAPAAYLVGPQGAVPVDLRRYEQWLHMLRAEGAAEGASEAERQKEEIEMLQLTGALVAKEQLCELGYIDGEACK